MLNLPKSQFIQTIPLQVASDILAIEEGSALVYVWENGLQKVKPSTGASGEFFAGVSFSRATTPTDAPIVEEITIPEDSPYTVTLAKTPVSDPGVVVLAEGSNPKVVLAKGSSADADEYAISGKVITVHSSYAGRTIKVTYRYTLSHAEAIYKFNFDSFATVDLVSAPTVGVVKDGFIVTDCYDVTADWSSWSASNPVTLSSDGKFTLGGSGEELTNVAVMAIPSVLDGFLYLHLAAR